MLRTPRLLMPVVVAFLSALGLMLLDQHERAQSGSRELLSVGSMATGHSATRPRVECSYLIRYRAQKFIRAGSKL